MKAKVIDNSISEVSDHKRSCK